MTDGISADEDDKSVVIILGKETCLTKPMP